MATVAAVATRQSLSAEAASAAAAPAAAPAAEASVLISFSVSFFILNFDFVFLFCSATHGTFLHDFYCKANAWDISRTVHSLLTRLIINSAHY